MAICENKIFENIYSTCENKIVSGIEQKVYLFNREDIEYTVASTSAGKSLNEITSFKLKDGVDKGYLAMGLKKNLTCGFERVISDTAPDSWTNTLTLVGYQFDKDASRNMDELGNLVAIVERKGTQSADGTFICLGLKNGLYVSTDTWSANENGGARQITLSSLDEAGEDYSNYVVTLSAQTPAITTYEGIKSYLDDLCPED